MNKQDLVKAVTDSANISQSAASAAINGFISSITQALQKGDSVTLIGLGTFRPSSETSIWMLMPF